MRDMFNRIKVHKCLYQIKVYKITYKDNLYKIVEERAV